MRIWTSEHTFDHSWETVVEAAVKKYPNPLCQHVVGTDTIDRKMTRSKCLQTKRLFTLASNIPGWIRSIVSTPKYAYALESSTIDRENRSYTVTTRNLTYMPWLNVEEKIKYYPDINNSLEKTKLIQESSVTITGFPIVANAFESWIENTACSNSEIGKQAIEWVIGNIYLEKNSKS